MKQRRLGRSGLPGKVRAVGVSNESAYQVMADRISREIRYPMG